MSPRRSRPGSGKRTGAMTPTLYLVSTVLGRGHVVKFIFIPALDGPRQMRLCSHYAHMWPLRR